MFEQLSLSLHMLMGPILERARPGNQMPRYKLRLPVVFYWNDGEHHAGGGFTSDIAIDRVFIHTSKCPPSGSDVRIEVLLPSLDGGDDEIRIECSGTVTQVIKQAGLTSFMFHGILSDDHLTRYVLP